MLMWASALKLRCMGRGWGKFWLHKPSRHAKLFKKDTKSTRSSSLSIPLKAMQDLSPCNVKIISLGFASQESIVVSVQTRPWPSRRSELPPQIFTLEPEEDPMTPKIFGPREVPLPIGLAVWHCPQNFLNNA